MERMYSISQVARMLGLGIDAVRFYEKKGLVHPQVNRRTATGCIRSIRLWSCWMSATTAV